MSDEKLSPLVPFDDKSVRALTLITEARRPGLWHFELPRTSLGGVTPLWGRAWLQKIGTPAAAGEGAIDALRKALPHCQIAA